MISEMFAYDQSQLRNDQVLINAVAENNHYQPVMHLNIHGSETLPDDDSILIFHASIASCFYLFSWHFQTLLLLKVLDFNLLLLL